MCAVPDPPENRYTQAVNSSRYYQAEWDGKDTHGNSVSSGEYLCRLNAGDVILTKKMVLIR